MKAGKRKKKKDNGTKLVQWAILSFSHKTLPTLFSLHFGETSFRWVWVENAWAPPKIFLSLPPYQTTPFLIFSPIFSPNFSILSKIHPSKHSVRAEFFRKTEDNEWVPCQDAGVSLQQLDENSEVWTS